MRADYLLKPGSNRKDTSRGETMPAQTLCFNDFECQWLKNGRAPTYYTIMLNEENYKMQVNVTLITETPARLECSNFEYSESGLLQPVDVLNVP